MIGWVAVLILAAVTFALAALALRLPREGWALFGAVLCLGLAGYAWQGIPEQPASPKAMAAGTAQSGEGMVSARLALFDPVQPKPSYLITSDAFARKGQFDDAATLLRKGLNDNPNHLEGWLALGMSLVGHADGAITPAALYAYEQASKIDPSNPGPEFFLGISYLQSGQVRQARKIWNELLERSPSDAPWRAELEVRIAALDEMIANAPMLQQSGR